MGVDYNAPMGFMFSRFWDAQILYRSSGRAVVVNAPGGFGIIGFLSPVKIIWERRDNLHAKNTQLLNFSSLFYCIRIYSSKRRNRIPRI